MTAAHTPAAIDVADLDAATVGRQALFDRLVRRLRGAARDGSRPHTLLVAPRGAGKTHTLRVALKRACDDAATAERVLPVVIPEDSLAIGSYLDLLVEAARAIDPDLEVTARALRRDKDAVGIEQAISTVAAGRMVLLAVENLDRVFDGIGLDGQGSLRAWVETSTEVTIFATTPALFSGVSSRRFPWYGSFMVETLGDLTPSDVAALVARGARSRGAHDVADFVETDSGASCIAEIYRVFGGAPRPWQLLAQFADVAALQAVTPAVEALLDRLVPDFQRRLWGLPAGEQRLVVELARADGPRTVGDLAAAVGVSNQSAATALGRLGGAHWVTSTKDDADRRATWYDLTDPLLRRVLHYREQT